MATRLIRTDRIANIADFGAVEGNPTQAAIASNSLAFRLALASGARRIAIPAGTWHFEEILFDNQVWLPPGTEIFGQGRVGQTTLIYRPSNEAIPAFSFAPGSPPAKSTIRDLALFGPVAGESPDYQPGDDDPPRGIGIRFDGSWFCHVRDVVLWYFEVGVDFRNSEPGRYNGYNYVERFEVNGCRTGVYIGDHTNSCVLQNGRIQSSLATYTVEHVGGEREEGVGIDIDGTLSMYSVPQGAQGVVISGVTIEGAPLCLRIAASKDIVVQGCYLEPGEIAAGNIRRRSLHVDDVTMGLSMVGTLFSEPSYPAGEWDWTPTYVELPPENRGLVDVSQSPQDGIAWHINGYGGAISGATAAKANLLKNSDMSRGAMFWSSSVPAPTVSPHQLPFVTGGASTMLTVSANTLEHIYQDFVVASGVRSVTVGVRYQLLDEGVNAFRIDLVDPSSGTRIGFFSDVGPGPTGWRIRSLTGRFDGLAGGVTGPRTLRVRVYPYNGDPLAMADQRVLIDSIWVVEGEYAASYRSYTDGVELLVGDDREQFFAGAGAIAPIGPIADGPTQIPANAIGMTVEMSIQGSSASTTPTILRVDDLSGTSSTRDVHALVDGRPTIIDYTLPFTPGVLPQWSVLGASPANVVDYAVRIKAWILRL